MIARMSAPGAGFFDPFRLMEEEMDTLFGRLMNPTADIRAARRGSFPLVNIGATPERVDVYMFAAGLDPKSLDISLEQNLLTVCGKREEPASEDAEYYRQERFGGEFRRVVTLPEDVDPDRADAKYQDGVIHVMVFRRESVRPHQIEVK